VSLTTYATVRAAILDWSWTQGGLTDTIIKNDIFPQLWSIMYHGDRQAGQQAIEPLRVRAMISSATLTTSSTGTVTISTGVSASWLDFVEITPTLQGAQSLNYLAPWTFRKQFDMLQNTTPPPVVYTIEGDTLQVAPKAASASLAAVWYQRFTALSADSDTDWIITSAPHVYMTGGMWLAAKYMREDAGVIADFRGQFAGAIKALNMTDIKRQSSGSVAVARPRSIA
jgi:hypothetical protein